MLVNLAPRQQSTVRFAIKNPLSAIRISVLPEGTVRVRLYEYRDDIVLEYIDAESSSFISGYEIDPVAGPELWIDLVNTSDAPRAVVASFILEKGQTT